MSSLVDNLSDRLHSNEFPECNTSLAYIKVKGNQWNYIQLIFKCLNCNKNYNKDISKELINKFSSTYKFCDRDVNKFILLLRKGAFPLEHMVY